MNPSDNKIEKPNSIARKVLNVSDKSSTIKIIIIIFVFIFAVFIISILSHYTIEYLIKVNILPSQKIIEPEKSDVMNKAIDLLNLIIALCGFIFTVLAIFTALHVSRWDQKLQDIKDKYDDALKLQEEFEGIETNVKDLKKYMEFQKEFLNRFYSNYSRALYRYAEGLFEDSIIELKKIVAYIDDSNLNFINSQHAIIGDVYFQLAKAYFAQADFESLEIQLDRLDQALLDLDKAINYYEFANENISIANAVAYKAVISAYMGYINKEGEKTAEVIDQYSKKVEAILNKNSQNISSSEYSYLPLYNIACAYAVSYKYSDNKWKPEVIKLRKKALDNLEIVWNKHAITKDYILSDRDWDYFVNLPEGENVSEIDRVDRKKFKDIIKEFVSKKSPMWEIAKLYAWLTKLSDKSEDKKNLHKKYKERAIIYLKKSYDSKLIDQSRVKNSKAFEDIQNEVLTQIKDGSYKIP
jgi:cell division protein FtsB